MTTLNILLSKLVTTHLSLPHTFVAKDGATLPTPRSISTLMESLFQSTNSLRPTFTWRNLMKLLNCQHQQLASIMWFLCPWWAPCTTILVIRLMSSIRIDPRRNVRLSFNVLDGSAKNGTFWRVAHISSPVMERAKKCLNRLRATGIQKLPWKMLSQAKQSKFGPKIPIPRSMIGCTVWINFTSKLIIFPKDFKIKLRQQTRGEGQINVLLKTAIW